jgi:DNA repair protein RecO (recombination protein O)
MNLIKILTAENQKNINIYELIKDFYLLLDKDNWIKRYIFWELELFRVLGYDLELKNLVDKEVVGNKLQYISKSNTNKKIIPNFLIEKNEEPVDLTNLKKGLFLTGDYLEKTILRPNNLSQPISRLNFINSLK